jgi:L-threonylcarbamoyladenylate synthase
MKRIDARREPPETVLREATAVTALGGVIIFPTDTVYGIGGLPSRPKTIERIFRLKGRAETKPLGLYFASVDALAPYLRGNAAAERVARTWLPGPLTIIVKRPPAVPAAVAGGLDSIGLRVPGDELARAIISRTGPLAATSANVSGSPAYRGGPDHGGLPGADLFIDAGPSPLGVESTVLDLSGPQPLLVREGAIATADLEKLLGPIGRLTQ